MHFAVPEVHELQESNGTNYQAFHLHVNGAMHCIVRYSQLHNMNEQLKLEFQQNVPQFPPKKIFTLKGNELEERRKQLEVYMQELSQNEELLSSQIFTSFLQKAQQETRLETTTQVELDIYLMNHNKVTLTCNSTDQSEDVLENLMLLIGLEEDLVYYFGLFLVEDYNVDDDRLVLVRQLQNFECPYITLKSLEGKSNYKIVVRKTYWDTSFDAMLLHNSVALNLLHTQAQKDIKMGWIECPKQTRKQLAQYTRKHSKREYMQMVQSLHKYNYLQFEPCECSYPVVGSRVVVSVGGYELRLMYLGKNEEKTTEEATFQVTRIKSWKIACRHKLKSPSRHTNNNNNAELQLSFEYLIDKENLKWIHIQSNQAIVISMSIKSMVNEIVMKKNGNKVKKPSDRPNRKHYEYKPRDESASQHLFNSQQNHQDDHQKEEKINLKKRITNKMRRLSWRRSVNLPSDQEGGDYSRLLGNEYGDMGDTGIGEDNL